MSTLLSVSYLLLGTQTLQAALIALLLYLFSREFQRDPLHYWGWSWGALGFYYIGLLLVSTLPLAAGMLLAIRVAAAVAGLWSALWLVFGTIAFSDHKVSPGRERALLAATALVAAMGVLAPRLSEDPILRSETSWALRCLLGGTAYCASGWLLWRTSSRQRIGRLLVCGAFWLYGVKLFHYFILTAGGIAAGTRPDSVVWWSFGDIFAQGAMGLGTIVWLLEREHEHVLDTSTHLQRLSFFDATTGLPNRALLEERGTTVLRQAATTGQSVAMLLVDFDHFGRITNHFGHVAGDDLLRLGAARMQLLLSASDSLARFGGDQFVILSPGLDRVEAEALGGRVLAKLRESFELGEGETFLTASVGVAVSPADGAAFADLLQGSQLALGRAKQAGGDQLRPFDASLTTQARARLSFESSLRRAVAEGELELHYQPIWNLESGQFDTVEALLRWRHPQDGLLLPDRFLHEVEAEGLSRLIVPWALRQACRQAKAWQRRMPDLRVAVNLDAPTFQRPDLVREVLAALEEHDLEPASLELEITETVAMRDVESAQKMLRQLRRRGVTVALDDFGTGYSSLSLLQDFPVDTLKIDGSFVRGLDRGTGARAIVSAVVILARALDLRVIAEGVETVAQRDALERLGCRLVQGFLLARPLPVAELENLLAAQSPLVAAAGGTEPGRH